MDKLNTKKIKELFEQTGKSQTEFASFIGISESNLSTAFKGGRNIPIGCAFKVATFLEIDNAKVLIESVSNNRESNKHHKEGKVS